MIIFKNIVNWATECDECGDTKSEWYDFGTTVICESCLQEHISFEGKCEICGRAESDAFYKVGNQCVCDECVEELKRS